MKLSYVIVILLACPRILLAEPEIKGNPEELAAYLLGNRKIMVISGEGEEKTVADNAIITLIVKTNDNALKNALLKNKKIRQAIRKSLVEKKIAANKISFSKFASTPEYGWFGDKPTSYTISNEVKITIDTEEDLEAIALIVDRKEEVYFTKTELEHTSKSKSKEKALDRALGEVIAKKEKYETRLGIKLKAIRVLEESTYERQPVPAHQERKSKRMEIDSSYKTPLGAKSRGFGEIIYSALTRVEYVVDNK